MQYCPTFCLPLLFLLPFVHPALWSVQAFEGALVHTLSQQVAELTAEIARLQAEKAQVGSVAPGPLLLVVFLFIFCFHAVAACW
jgi:hypothetical protein